MKDPTRCDWAGSDPAYIAYHDHEWGVPVHDDRKHFEMLTLEGFQAGLSWITILKRREQFRKAFAKWNWNKIAKFTGADVARLMADPGIIRNRLKIAAAINNACASIEVRKSSARSTVISGGLPKIKLSGRKPGPKLQGSPHPFPRIRRAEQRPEKARLLVRRNGNLLRPHAGNRDGGRSQEGCFRRKGKVID